MRTEAKRGVLIALLLALTACPSPGQLVQRAAPTPPTVNDVPAMYGGDAYGGDAYGGNAYGGREDGHDDDMTDLVPH